jgi:hypothetical protein
MTTFQKINRRRWPTWARMALLATAASMMVALILPRVVSSNHGGPDPIVTEIIHVGGNAVEDCDFAVANDMGAWSYDATAFTNNPGRDDGVNIDVVDALGVDTGWDVQVTGVQRTDFDWILFDNLGNDVEHDEDLVAPGHNRTVSHVSFCLSEIDGSYSVTAVEVKGSQDTNHYLYLYACEDQTFSNEYAVTCNGKYFFGAEFEQFDTNTDGKADTIAFITSGEGVAFYIEHLTFQAQEAADLNDVTPFVLLYDDTAQDGSEPVVVPQCLFNPDLAADGVEDGLVETDETSPNYAGDALPINTDPASPLPVGAQHTTCYFGLSFVQLANGDWAPSYDLLNKGDGWRTIY